MAAYNYGYTTSTITDNGGNKISQVVIGSVPVNVDVDVKLYALSPLVLWITNKKFLGANYGGYIGPSFSNANIAASLSVIEGRESILKSRNSLWATCSFSPCGWDGTANTLTLPSAMGSMRP